ncbi:MAG: hypothetical protein E3K37_03145 [Candidatus Kuenenia sp.]|nr:hypothetical protein [Candidatus Kuenenia hertensis]
MGKTILFTGIACGLVMFSAVFMDREVSAEIFTVTGYCSCEKCCDKSPDDEWYGITATGTKARWGTIAVDRKIIRLGSELRIEGFENIIFKAEDVGGAIKGKRIDIWFPDHREALRFGKQKRNVWYDENDADV